MRLPIFQVDAFADRIFSGNPAAVVPMNDWPSDEVLSSIASENNLSETAFLVPLQDDGEADFRVRWFTPTVEVALCGHATLAAAHVLRAHLGFERERVAFASASGPLGVQYLDSGYELDFPAIATDAVEAPEGLADALGADPREVRMPKVAVNAGKNLLCVFDREEDVLALRPDFGAVRRIHKGCVCCTAPGDEADFVSRFFAPGAGIDEDPVTGSTHTMMVPYWSERLGRSELIARQRSARGGELRCQARGERVGLAGRAVTYLTGTIEI